METMSVDVVSDGNAISEPESQSIPTAMNRYSEGSTEQEVEFPVTMTKQHDAIVTLAQEGEVTPMMSTPEGEVPVSRSEMDAFPVMQSDGVMMTQHGELYPTGAQQYSYPVQYQPYYQPGYYSPRMPTQDTPSEHTGGKVHRGRMQSSRFPGESIPEYQLEQLHPYPMAQGQMQAAQTMGQLDERAQDQQSVPHLQELQPVPYDASMYQTVPPIHSGASGPYMTQYAMGEGVHHTPVLIHPSNLESGNYMSTMAAPVNAANAAGAQPPQFINPSYSGYMTPPNMTPTRVDSSDSDYSLEHSPLHMDPLLPEPELDERPHTFYIPPNTPKPLTLDDAVSLYISHLIKENERIVRISDLLTPARPVNWANERYAREVLRAAAKFPTKKFRSFLAHFNIEIEVNYENNVDDEEDRSKTTEVPSNSTAPSVSMHSCNTTVESQPSLSQAQNSNTYHPRPMYNPHAVTPSTDHVTYSATSGPLSTDAARRFPAPLDLRPVPPAYTTVGAGPVPAFTPVMMPGSHAAHTAQNPLSAPVPEQVPVPISLPISAPRYEGGIAAVRQSSRAPMPPSCLRTASQNLGAALHDPANYLPASKPRVTRSSSIPPARKEDAQRVQSARSNMPKTKILEQSEYALRPGNIPVAESPSVAPSVLGVSVTQEGPGHQPASQSFSSLSSYRILDTQSGHHRGTYPSERYCNVGENRESNTESSFNNTEKHTVLAVSDADEVPCKKIALESNSKWSEVSIGKPTSAEFNTDVSEFRAGHVDSFSRSHPDSPSGLKYGPVLDDAPNVNSILATVQSGRSIIADAFRLSANPSSPVLGPVQSMTL